MLKCISDEMELIFYIYPADFYLFLPVLLISILPVIYFYLVNIIKRNVLTDMFAS